MGKKLYEQCFVDHWKKCIFYILHSEICQIHSYIIADKNDMTTYFLFTYLCSKVRKHTCKMFWLFSAFLVEFDLVFLKICWTSCTNLGCKNIYLSIYPPGTICNNIRHLAFILCAVEKQSSKNFCPYRKWNFLADLICIWISDTCTWISHIIAFASWKFVLFWWFFHGFHYFIFQKPWKNWKIIFKNPINCQQKLPKKPFLPGHYKFSALNSFCSVWNWRDIFKLKQKNSKSKSGISNNSEKGTYYDI